MASQERNMTNNTQERKRSNRYSQLFSTPLSQSLRLSRSRDSISRMEIDSANKCAEETLFETLMNDPVKRGIVLNLLMQDKSKLEAIKQAQADDAGKLYHSPLKKLKLRHICESPTALFRRRALEKRDESAATPASQMTPSPLPFERLLEGVVAYVEVKSNGGDRSEGAKALMRSMGATVKDSFTRDVTHVVFKDGSFNTYHKAKLLKVHLVSVLWLEAIRRNHACVPERNYPALGTDLYKVNLSQVCQEIQRDYEDVVRDELHRSLCLNTINQPSQLRLAIDKVASSSRRSSSVSLQSSESHTEDVIDVSQEWDTASVISKSGRCLPKGIIARKLICSTPDELHTISRSPDSTSDSDSELGMINGLPVKKVNSCLELISNAKSPACKKSKGTITRNMDNFVLGITSSDKTINASTKENCSVDSMSLLSHNTRIETNVASSGGNIKKRKTVSNYANVDNNLDVSPNKSKGRRRTTQLSTAEDEMELPSGYDCQENRQSGDMDLTDCANVRGIFVTKRKTSRTPLKTYGIFRNVSGDINPNQESSKSVKNTTLSYADFMHNDRLDASSRTERINSAKKISLDISATENCLNKSNAKKTSTDSNSTKKLSSSKSTTVEELSLRISIGSTVSTKSSKPTSLAKSSTTQELSSLRLSLSSNVNSSNENLHSVEDPQSKTKNSTDAAVLNNDMFDCGKRKHGVSFVPQEKSRSYSTKHDGMMTSHEVSEDANSSKRVRCDVQSNDSKVHHLRSCTKSAMQKEDASSSFEETSNQENPASLDRSLATKGKRMRRLYTLKSCLDEVAVPLNERDRNATENKKTKPTIFKKPPPAIRPAPLLLTPSAKTCVENVKRKQFAFNGNDENVDSSRKKTEIKPKKAVKNLADKKQQNKTKKVLTEKQENELKKSKSQTNKEPVLTPIRKSMRLLKPKGFSSDEVNDVCVAIKPQRDRRSTLEFMPKTFKSPSRIRSTQANRKVKKSSVVCTRFHSCEVQVFQQIVRKLGGFFVEDEVSQKTTHLVAGEPKRTVNLLRAIAMGCWVLKAEWLYKSLEADCWLSEEDFELTEFSPAVQQCRQQRQAFGPLYCMDIFENVGPIYIARSSLPRCSDLQDLVTMCKGNVTTMQRNAAVVVGEYVRHENVTCVQVKWVLDSIMYNKKKAFKNYIISK